MRSVLVANRGEVAVRLIAAVHAAGLEAIAVFASDEAGSMHVRKSDRAYDLGISPTLYNDIDAVLKVALQAKVHAVHPGYGFLSENPDAARAFELANIAWLGPSPSTITLFGLKHTARAAAVAANIPVVPGSGIFTSYDDAKRLADTVGYPVLVKASAGGGGMGQAIARSPSQLLQAFQSVVTQASSLFATNELYLERYVERARHVEVQIFGDGRGLVIALGDRDCSVQRRRQKIIEEACAPMLPPKTRAAIRQAAVTLCANHCYRSAGTVEFIVDSATNDWYFLEVNTRLQVEHGITELLTGIDIPLAMIKLAAGNDVLSDMSQFQENGVAIEARVYAENPVKNYRPCPGIVSEMLWPTSQPETETLSVKHNTRIRVDAWAERGTVVAPHYDPLLGKVLAWGITRPQAILSLQNALRETVVRGVDTNIDILIQILSHPAFLRGAYTTDLLTGFKPVSRTVEVLHPGVQSSLQDYPGRIGYWDVGVSPSGPLDAYAMGMANALVGNSKHQCAIEFTLSGPTLIFHTDSVIAITGATFYSYLNDGISVSLWTPFKVSAGSKLTISSVQESKEHSSSKVGWAGGKVGYLAIRGGFDVPKYLGSASTFATGKFGGLTGSFVSAGDFLPICEDTDVALASQEQNGLAFRWPLDRQLTTNFIPRYGSEWLVAALNGPHASPDFLQIESLHELWTEPYQMHHASNRLGARLIGPVPKWARMDGGSAGLHPSNLHDYTYAPGAVNFSGNTPIVLMVDGPSLGGFVCPITVASADLWKIGQASPGDVIRFKQVDFHQAKDAMMAMEDSWDAVKCFDLASLDKLGARWSPWWVKQCSSCDLPSILTQLNPVAGDLSEVKVTYRMSGDEHILIEYGEIEMDLLYRLRVHMVMEVLKNENFITELCPGVRSLLVGYDRRLKNVNEIVSVLVGLENGVLGSVEDLDIPSRIIELPFAFDDQWTKDAQARYLRSVRPSAPYMPSNVEFVRRINGLRSIEEVQTIITNAEYLVLGLGDVYLGAPCAIPVDPRHRLVTSKYNPARTYTPEGAVGIGGAYMCIYGMDSPGGYQLVGRTLPIWDTYGSIPKKCRGSPKHIPWLLRFFDRVKFFLVADEELKELRAQYRRGNYQIKMRTENFSYANHKKFLVEHRKSIEDFEKKREIAYTAERNRWERDGEGSNDAAARHASAKKSDVSLNAETAAETSRNMIKIISGMCANVWSVLVAEGDVVQKGDILITLESMKVEISVEAPAPGFVDRILVSKGDSVEAGEVVCLLSVLKDGNEISFSICELQKSYTLGLSTEEEIIERSVDAAKSMGNLFSVLPDKEQCIIELESNRTARKNGRYSPLIGVPFVVSESANMKGHQSLDGINTVEKLDLESSAIVQALRDAGATLIGILRETFVQDPNELCSGTRPNESAAMAIKRRAASFAVLIDQFGSSMTTPSLYGLVGNKTTEGLLPLQIDDERWSIGDSIALYTLSASDMRTVFNICMTSRERGGAWLRQLQVPTDALSTQNRPYRRQVVGYCHENNLLKLNSDGDIETSVFVEHFENLRQRGVDVREVNLESLLETVDILKKAPLHAYSKISNSDQRRHSKPNSTDVLEVTAAWHQIHKCRRKMNSQIWTQVDAVILPLALRSGDNENALIFMAALAFLNLCAVSIPLPATSTSFGSQSATMQQSALLLGKEMDDNSLLDFIISNETL